MPPNLTSRNLSHEQQRLINMYINQYNQTNTHIDMLLDMLDEIRENIINIINASQPRRTRLNRHTRNSNTNINRIINEMFNTRQHNNIYYDYNNPINPDIYTDMSFNNIYRNNNNYQPNNRNVAFNQSPDLTSLLANFLNTTVTVRPTNEQIESASRLVRFGDIENPVSEACPISLDEFNNDDVVRQLLPCGHLFHTSQFDEWFSEHVRCPVCRYDIRNYRQLSRRNSPNNIVNETSTISNNYQSQSDTNTNTNTNTNTTQTSIPDTQVPQTEHTVPQTYSDNNSISSNSSRSNMNVIRDPLTNQIEHLTFDISDQQFTNNFIDNITRNIFQSMLNPHTQNNNGRFMIDSSNNILFYETIIRPNSTQNNDNNNDDNDIS